MDIEVQLLNEYKTFIKNKVNYECKIFSKTPVSLSKFPTIILKETGNADISYSRSNDTLEYMNQLVYTIEIYTKDTVVEDEIIKSKQIMSELKEFTFEFFRGIGFNRMSCTVGEYTNYTVDRLIIVEQGKLNNWNKNII